MFYTYQILRARLAPLNKLKLPPSFITDRSKAVALLWFSVACFDVRVSVMFHLMFVHYTFWFGLVC